MREINKKEMKVERIKLDSKALAAAIKKKQWWKWPSIAARQQQETGIKNMKFKFSNSRVRIVPWDNYKSVVLNLF